MTLLDYLFPSRRYTLEAACLRAAKAELELNRLRLEHEELRFRFNRCCGRIQKVRSRIDDLFHDYSKLLAERDELVCDLECAESSLEIEKLYSEGCTHARDKWREKFFETRETLAARQRDLANADAAIAERYRFTDGCTRARNKWRERAICQTTLAEDLRQKLADLRARVAGFEEATRRRSEKIRETLKAIEISGGTHESV